MTFVQSEECRHVFNSTVRARVSSSLSGGDDWHTSCETHRKPSVSSADHGLTLQETPDKAPQQPYTPATPWVPGHITLSSTNATDLANTKIAD